jgi:hypothetical protein
MNPATLSLAGEMKRFGKRYAPERFYLLIGNCAKYAKFRAPAE